MQYNFDYSAFVFISPYTAQITKKTKQINKICITETTSQFTNAYTFDNTKKSGLFPESW